MPFGTTITPSILQLAVAEADIRNWCVADGVTDDAVNLLAALTARAGKELNIPSGVSVYLANKVTYAGPVLITGQGRFVHTRKGAFLFQLPLTSIGAVTATSTVTYPATDISGSQVAKIDFGSAPALVRGDIAHITSDDALIEQAGAFRGETLRVQEVAGNSIYSGHSLELTYATTVVLHKLNTAKISIIGPLFENPTYLTDNGVDGDPAVHIISAVNPVVECRFEKQACASVQVLGCWAPMVDISVFNARNAHTVGAYAYGVVLSGATSRADVKVNATGLRHAVTGGSNVSSVVAQKGIALHNKIHDCIANDMLSASYDTHQGMYHTRFENCNAVGSVGNVDYAAETIVYAFTDRGAGTQWVGCSALGRGGMNLSFPLFNRSGVAGKYTTRVVDLTLDPTAFSANASFKIDAGFNSTVSGYHTIEIQNIKARRTVFTIGASAPKTTFNDARLTQQDGSFTIGTGNTVHFFGLVRQRDSGNLPNIIVGASSSVYVHSYTAEAAFYSSNRLFYGNGGTGTVVLKIGQINTPLADPTNVVQDDALAVVAASYMTPPAFVRSIGASNAVAAAMEAFSAAMPKDGRYVEVRVPEQGVIELGPFVYTLEKPFNLNLAGVTESRYGLTIRGQGMSTTKFLMNTNAPVATFRDVFGDGIWRAFRILASNGTKFGHIKLQGFAVLNYATQGADGVTPLTDPCRVLDLQYLQESSLEDVYVYSRTLRPLSLDQYGFSFANCYYLEGQNLRAFCFQGPTTKPAMNGTLAPRRCGVGFRIKENNAITLTAPVSLGTNLSFHLIDENGATLQGGSSEHINKTIFFDGVSSGSVLTGHRSEYHISDNRDAFEGPGEIYLARFGERTRFCSADFTMGETGIPNHLSTADFSSSQTNIVRASGVRKKPMQKNLLAAVPTWVSSDGTTTASTDAPPGTALTASREVTYTGAYNGSHYTQLDIDPSCGSISVRVWMKRVSGLGMLNPEISTLPVSGNRIYNSVLFDTARRLESVTTLPLATSGHSFSSGTLRLVTLNEHQLQPGVRLQSGASLGTMTAGTNLYISAVPSANQLDLVASSGGTLADPGVITAPSALTVPSDMTPLLFLPNMTNNWVEFSGIVPVRLPCTGLSLNGSNKPVIAMPGNNSLGFVTGSLLRLQGFADSRLNIDYTVQSGDISGGNLTLSTLEAMPDMITTVTGVSQTASHYGYVGLRRVWLSYAVRTTNTGQGMVWRFAGEEVVAGLTSS